MTVYSLADPRTKLIRYIGKAIDAEARYHRHLIDANNRRMRSCRWIKSLLVRGLRPILSVIEECDGEGSVEEVFHIALARRDGLKLCNATAGGEGCTGYRHTPESRRKMSEVRKGVPKSAEFKAMVSRAHMGRRRPRESVERGAAKRRGRKLPEWQIEMLRKLSIGRKKSAEELESLSKRMRAVPHEEHLRRAKVRERFFVSPWTSEDGQRLAERRKKIGVSSRVVGRVAGLGSTTIDRIEAAIRRPRKANLQKIITALDDLERQGYTPEIIRAKRVAKMVASRWPNSVTNMIATDS